MVETNIHSIYFFMQISESRELGRNIDQNIEEEHLLAKNWGHKHTKKGIKQTTVA